MDDLDPEAATSREEYLRRQIQQWANQEADKFELREILARDDVQLEAELAASGAPSLAEQEALAIRAGVDPKTVKLGSLRQPHPGMLTYEAIAWLP